MPASNAVPSKTCNPPLQADPKRQRSWRWSGFGVSSASPHRRALSLGRLSGPLFYSARARLIARHVGRSSPPPDWRRQRDGGTRPRADAPGLSVGYPHGGGAPVRANCQRSGDTFSVRAAIDVVLGRAASPRTSALGSGATAPVHRRGDGLGVGFGCRAL